MAAVRFVANALFFTVGLGVVPAVLYLVAGLLSAPLAPPLARHLRRLARRVSTPVGTRVVDWAGRSVFRILPALVGAIAAGAAHQAVFGDDFDEGPDDLDGLRQTTTVQLLSVAWFLLVGWELFLFHVAAGLLLSLTLIGLPFGVRHFGLGVLALFPRRAHILYEGEPLPDHSEQLAH